MRLLPCVTPHVDHQHVLSLEGLLLARTLLPAAHKLLLLTVDVVVVDVLRRQFTLNQSSQCIITYVCVIQQILVFSPPEDSPSFTSMHTCIHAHIASDGAIHYV